MAVNLDFDESKYFKFVIISDKSKPSKNNFIEKPSKDKDSMSTNSSPTPPTSTPSTPPNNEKLDEKQQNSQETNKQTDSEVKLSDTPNGNGESTKEQKEQKNEEKAPRLTVEVPSKSTSSQIVTSPREIKASEITGAKTPEPPASPISPSPPPQNSNIFKNVKNVGKKFGNMIRNSPNNGTVSPDQEEVATSNSEMQQEQIVENNVANDKYTENTANVVGSDDENQKEVEDKKVTPETKGEDKKVTPETTAAKKRTGSLSSLVNMKLFITRTSSVVVEKLQEKFDNLDRHIYPDIDDYVEENQENSSRGEVVVSEREQLLENKDVEIKNDTSQKSQTTQSTQNVMAEIGDALNERKEKLDSIGERAEQLNNDAFGFLEAAAKIRQQQEQKSKSWKFW